MRAQYSPQQHRPAPAPAPAAAPSSSPASRFAGIAQRGPGVGSPARSAGSTPAAAPPAGGSAFSVRSVASGRSAGSGGSAYDRNADPATLFVKQVRIGASPALLPLSSAERRAVVGRMPLGSCDAREGGDPARRMSKLTVPSLPAGKGSFGEVYKGYSVKTQKAVAIKGAWSGCSGLLSARCPVSGLLTSVRLVVDSHRPRGRRRRD